MLVFWPFTRHCALIVTSPAHEASFSSVIRLRGGSFLAARARMTHGTAGRPGVGLTVGDGDGVGVPVCVGDGVPVSVGDGDGVGVTVSVGEGVLPVGVGVGVPVSVGDGVGVGMTGFWHPSLQMSLPGRFQLSPSCTPEIGGMMSPHVSPCTMVGFHTGPVCCL